MNKSAFLGLLLAIAGSPVAAQHIDPPLLPLQPLIDSLVAVTGGAPDTILFRPTPLDGPENSTGWYEPKRRHMRVSPQSVNRRRTLIHEFGHLLQHDNQPLLFAWADHTICDGAMPRRGDMEQFANDFADAFDALSRQKLPRQPGARFLAAAIAARLTVTTR